MNFTQEQISDLLFDLAIKKGDTHLLLNLTLNAFTKSRGIFASKGGLKVHTIINANEGVPYDV